MTSRNPKRQQLSQKTLISPRRFCHQNPGSILIKQFLFVATSLIAAQLAFAAETQPIATNTTAPTPLAPPAALAPNPSMGGLTPQAPLIPQKNENLDAANCSPDENAAKLGQRLASEIQSLKGSYKPAIAFEESGSRIPRNVGQGISGEYVDRLVDQRARDQGGKLSKALFAALNSPNAIADGASDALNGDPKRRVSIGLYSQCPNEGNAIRSVIQNQRVDNMASSCGGTFNADPVAVSLHGSQVYQSAMNVDQVKNAFARQMMTPSESTNVTMCLRNCQQSGYKPLDARNFKPAPDNKKEYFIRTEKDFGLPALIGGGPMVNFTTMKLVEIPLCKSKFYLVLGVANGHSLGFDRSTLAVLMAPIAGKTLVLGDLSAQAFQSPNTTASWPLSFPSYAGTVQKAMSSDLYADISKIIGSTEKVESSGLVRELSRPGNRPNRYAGPSVAAVSSQ